MDVDFSEVDLGFVVSLGTLREVLKAISLNGKRWWIASDPHDAAETGFITIGHGDQKCVDRLNTLYFHIPVVGNQEWKTRTDRLIVMFDSTTVTAEDPGYYIDDGRVMQDTVEDLCSFFEPVEWALIDRLQARD
jgi:hypothetical protein